MRFSTLSFTFGVAAFLASHVAPTPTRAEDVTFATSGTFFRTTTGEDFGVEKYVMALDGLFRLDPAFNGEFNLRVFDRATMFANLSEDLEAAATGAIQLTYSNSQLLESLEPAYKVVNFPGLFEDFPHFKRTMQSDAWGALEDRLEQKGVKVVSWILNGGSLYFFSRDPLDSKQDLEGKRIRYPGGEAWKLSIESLGAQAIALPYTEVVTALQTNLIDGMVTNFNGGVPYFSLRDFTPHATMVLLSVQPIAIVANADWWNGMTEDQQNAITMTFEVLDASAYFDGLLDGLVNDWVAEGFTAEVPSDAEAWVSSMQDASRHLLDDVDPALLEAVEAAR